MRHLASAIALLMLLLVAGCVPGEPAGEGAPPAPTATPGMTPTPDPTAVLAPQPTPATVTLTIWGPPLYDPAASAATGTPIDRQNEAFEALFPDIRLRYEAKPPAGPASVLAFMRTASEVAPAVLPDLIILPTTQLQEAAQSQLLFPLDTIVAEPLRAELFPLAIRDTRVGDQWLGLPLALRVEHGVSRVARRSSIPASLAELAREDAPTWQFAGQSREDGTMSNALLLQLIAIGEGLPAPGVLPERDALLALFTTFKEAERSGAIPRQVLSISEEDDLYTRLSNGQATLIESDSSRFLVESANRTVYAWVPLPTLGEAPVSVAEGYLLALTTNDARTQEAAARYVEWLLEPGRWSERAAAIGLLPSGRAALEGALEDEEYAAFMTTLLERSWLRPGGPAWSDFARAVQEEFRMIMTDQLTPDAAVDDLLTRYGP